MRTIAVVGPGAGWISSRVTILPNFLPGQLKSVLTGIKQAVGKQTKVVYEQGCDFYKFEWDGYSQGSESSFSVGCSSAGFGRLLYQ